MTLQRLARAALLAGLLPLIAGCGAGDDNTVGAMKAQEANALIESDDPTARYLGQTQNQGTASNSTIWDLFANNDNPNTTVEVNKYLWNASLDILSFLPIESVDPFTGVISTGYGTPPGSNRSYRATIYVQDPALDARSLKVALQARGKLTYLCGGLVPEADCAADVLACAQLHADSADGLLARDTRPGLLRTGLVARLPALQP
jgi:hypothetical protein